MAYLSPSGEYPLFIGDVQLVSPGFKAGDTLPEGWQYVEEIPYPELTQTQKATFGAPELVDGVLTETYVISELTPEELEIRQAPQTAKQKLVELGFTEMEIRTIAKGLVA